MVKEKFLISKIYGAYYEIYSPTLGKKRAVLRGKFRLENSKERHPFVVGDKILAIPSSGDEWVIDKLEERKNFLIRKSGLNDSHVLCSNVDQVAIFASLKDPETKEGFIDRALIASGKAGIPATIVFTKSDLVSENDYKKILSIYKNSGIDTMAVSVFNISSLENFRKVLEGKVTFLVGNSGVGKSTILNKFLDNNFQITAEISSSTGKGRHTTTNSNLVPLSFNTFLIDSPGVKEWGLLHLDEKDVIQNFPGAKNFMDSCEEINCCTLKGECKIMKFFESDSFSENRKKSLESILESLSIESSSQYKQDSFNKGKKKERLRKR